MFGDRKHAQKRDPILKLSQLESGQNPAQNANLLSGGANGQCQPVEGRYTALRLEGMPLTMPR